MNAAERRLIAYATVAHALVHVAELTYPALLTRIGDDFGVRAVILGTVSSMFGWAFGSSAIPAGFLTDRLGSRRVLLYTFTGASVAAVLVGLSPNEWFLAGTLALLGLCIGLYHPAGISLMAQGVRQRGLALGYHGVAGNLGQAAAPVLAIGLAVAIDWRAAFFFLGALTAVLALVFTRVVLPVQGQGEVVVTGSTVVREGAPQRRVNHFLVPLLMVYAAFVVNGMVYRGAITFLPKHMEDLVNKDLGGVFVTVALIMGAMGQYAGGSLSQRFKLERLAPLLTLLALPALVLTGIVEGAGLVVVASLFICLYFANQPVFTGLIADYTPAGAVGRSYGVSFFAGFGLGGTGGVLAGVLVDRWDTSAAFLGLSGLLAVTLALSLGLWAMSERRTSATVVMEERPSAQA
ncbi:MAG: MFS transporter [Chloroflexi bacterium]|nr:MFS transporter [Chloroflexota bacterium]